MTKSDRSKVRARKDVTVLHDRVSAWTPGPPPLTKKLPGNCKRSEKGYCQYYCTKILTFLRTVSDYLVPIFRNHLYYFSYATFGLLSQKFLGCLLSNNTVFRDFSDFTPLVPIPFVPRSEDRRRHSVLNAVEFVERTTTSKKCIPIPKFVKTPNRG